MGGQERSNAVEGGNFFNVQNAEIARLLSDVADLLEISAANPFRVRAYRNAARTVADHPDPLAELVQGGAFDLTELPGIGDGIAKEITILVETGTLPQRQELVATFPPGLLELLRLPGVGPKRVKLFYDQLKVNSVADLKAALDAGKIAKLPGFGPKLLEKLREGVAGAAAGGGPKRMVLHEAEQYARAIVEYLKAGAGIDEIDVAGSFRRRKETIGDLDIVVTCAPTKAQAVIERFGKFGEVREVAAQGDTRSTVRLSSGLQVDLRVVEPACFGAAMQYFTGSQAHNIELRKIAQAKSLKLNEYGVYRGSKRVAGRTEQDVYKALGLQWIPPEMRENRGEIARAKQHKLPKLVTLEEIHGDLQMHTDASDGKATLPEMIDAARALGYAYIAITDHSPRTSMAGQTPAEIRAQWKEIDRLNKGMRGVRVLKSVEMDILENGKLDLPDDLLAEADYVVATIHYGLTQTERQLTDRLLGAIENRWVDAIGHPTGRRLPDRPSYQLDFDVVAKAAASAKCLLEINGSERLDLPDTLAAAAKAHGVRFVLSTDAHNTRELGFMKFAVAVARRAWLEATDILNTRALPDFLKGLRRSRNR
jgi:DNA polymerase (family 10)